VGTDTGGITVTSVGNAGFLVRSGDAAILVDALYRDGVEGYDAIPGERRALLEEALPPFDGVDLLLVTHLHADHFDPEAVGRHLIATPAARLVTTRQAAGSLASAFIGYEEVKDRVIQVAPAAGTIIPVRGAGESAAIHVRVIDLPHGSVENIGFLVDMGGLRLLHVGDTEVTADAYARLGLEREAIDVTFLPYWNLVYEQWQGVPEAIGAETLVVMHLPLAGGPAEDAASTGGREAMIAGIRARHPGAVVLEEPMTSASIEAP